MTQCSESLEARERRHGDSARLICWSALVLDVVLAVSLFSHWLSSSNLGTNYGRHNSASAIGWSAAAFAAIAWGCTEVPLKIPAAKAQGALAFNAYTFIATGLCHCMFLNFFFVLGVTPQWQSLGALAALDLVIVQSFCRNAVIHLGISAAALWCSIGIGTSFAWGTLLFGDSPKSLWLALAGLGTLVLGIALLAYGWMVDCEGEETRRGAATDVEEDRPLLPTHDLRTSKLKGVAFAVGAGLADGSLVAFYQSLEGPSWSPIVMFSYFCSFGITMLAIGLTILTYTVLTCGKEVPFEASASAPGLMSGAMWTIGNCCSILASHFLGMSLSFPLTQTACAIGALLGMIMFDELRSFRSKQVFVVGLFVGACGVALLSVFGRTTHSSGHL